MQGEKSAKWLIFTSANGHLADFFIGGKHAYVYFYVILKGMSATVESNVRAAALAENVPILKFCQISSKTSQISCKNIQMSTKLAKFTAVIVQFQPKTAKWYPTLKKTAKFAALTLARLLV